MPEKKHQFHLQSGIDYMFWMAYTPGLLKIAGDFGY